ncbi:hypothetical protein [Ferruginibacter profundus]
MYFDKDDYVLITFKRMIEAKGFVIDDIDEAELIYLSKGDYEVRVSLDNLRKDYEQTPEDIIIEEFVEAVASAEEEMPDWETAKTGIYPSLCPSDFEFGAYINYPITDDFNMVIVYDSGNKKVWINEDQLDAWKIDNQTILQTAYKNLDIVLDNAVLEVEDFEGKKLAYFTLEDETMKSVLVLSKNLRKKVEPQLGWPIVTVIPVRDFSYLFAEKEFDFFAEKLADLIMDEYKNSGYPVTTEILLVDEAVKAIAKYEANEEE